MTIIIIIYDYYDRLNDKQQTMRIYIYHTSLKRTLNYLFGVVLNHYTSVMSYLAPQEYNYYIRRSTGNRSSSIHTLLYPALIASFLFCS